MRLSASLLKGTAVSLVISALAVYPAVAQGQTTNTTTTNQTSTTSPMMMGTVVGVYGNVARIQFQNGTTTDVFLSNEALETLSLRSGMMVSTNMMADGSVMIGMATAEGQAIMTPGSAMITGQRMVQGTVRSITGNIATVELADGTTVDFSIPRADVGSLGLISGSQVVVALGADRTVTNLALANTLNQRFETGTTLTQQQTTVTGTTNVTPRVTVTQTQPTTTTQQTTFERTTTENTTPRSGVRALW